MSKRLNKRQQREAEELELLKSEQERVAAATSSETPAQESADKEDANGVEDQGSGQDAPLNAFAAVRPLST